MALSILQPYMRAIGTSCPSANNRTEKRKIAVPAVRNEVHPVTLLQRKNAIYNCVTALIIFVLLASVISGYAAISANKLSNLSMQENIDELAAQKEKLELSINTKCTVQQISQTAEQRFGMSFPDSTQICYMQFSEPSTVEQETQVEQNPWYEELWNSLVGLLK